MIQNVAHVINIFYTAAICWQMNNTNCWWRGCEVSNTNYHDYDLNLSELTSWHLGEDLQKAGSRTCYKFFSIWLLLNWWEYTGTSNVHHKCPCPWWNDTPINTVLHNTALYLITHETLHYTVHPPTLVLRSFTQIFFLQGFLMCVLTYKNNVIYFQVWVSFALSFTLIQLA